MHKRDMCPRKFCFLWDEESGRCGSPFGRCRRETGNAAESDFYEPYEPELRRHGLSRFYFTQSCEEVGGMECKKAPLPREVRASVDRKMADRGYLPEHYVHPTRTTLTDIKCPLCYEYLSILCGGHSYEISCTVHGIISSARGV